MTCSVARADVTGTWTPNASVNITSSIRGITTTIAGNPGGGAYAAQTLATGSYWTNPYSGTVPGAPSAQVTVGIAGPYTITMTFSKPVNNPVLHIDRLGGAVGTTSNSSIWTLTSSAAQSGAVTMTKLSGNTALVVTTSSFTRQAGVLLGGATDCNLLLGTAACGSVQFNGTGVTSLTFSVVMSSDPGSGDALELAWSFVGSNIIVRKQSLAGTGSFSFTGTNGVPTTAFVLNTATTNPATSATFAIANHAAAITITEAAATGFQITATSCQDGGGNAVASSLSGQVLTVAAAAYDGNETITCTFTNSVVADLQVTKTNTPGSGPNDQASDAVTAGASTTYQIVVTNNGPGTVTGPVLRDTPVSGLDCPAASAVTCVGSPAGACAGPYTVSTLTSAGGITLGTLASGSSAQLSFACVVQ